jgi:hypothetical protein
VQNLCTNHPTAMAVDLLHMKSCRVTVQARAPRQDLHTKARLCISEEPELAYIS